jgi:hypothetical protein
MYERAAMLARDHHHQLVEPIHLLMASIQRIALDDPNATQACLRELEALPSSPNFDAYDVSFSSTTAALAALSLQAFNNKLAQAKDEATQRARHRLGPRPPTLAACDKVLWPNS